MVAQDRVALGPAIRPDPDPTVLTTQSLLREIENVTKIFETRLAGMDKAIELLQAFTNKTPDEIKDNVLGLEKLQNVKFDSIQTQFSERDTRTEQTGKDRETAINAALKAQQDAVAQQNQSNKEAIAKSEASFIKLIDALTLNTTTITTNLGKDISVLTSRVQTIEGVKKGGSELWGYIVGAGGLLLAVWAVFHSGAGQ